MLLVSGGKEIKKNLTALKLELSELENFLTEQQTNIKSTDVLTVDGNGRAYLKRKNQKYTISSFPLKEIQAW